jgi:hypothetical protein
MHHRREAILALVHSEMNQMEARSHRAASSISMRVKIINFTGEGAVMLPHRENLLPAHLHQEDTARGGMALI